jgi:hypothetical protein
VLGSGDSSCDIVRSFAFVFDTPAMDEMAHVKVGSFIVLILMELTKLLRIQEFTKNTALS